MVSFPDPHHPFNPPGKYWDMYKPEDMDIPLSFSDENWQRPIHVSAAERSRAERRSNLNGMGTVACTVREAQEARALTCGMLAMVDDAIGSVMSILERARVEASVGMQGVALDVVGGVGRDWAFIQYEYQRTSPAFGPVPRVHMLRKGNWRISVYNNSDFGELYDLAKDPGEMTNLWNEPEARGIRAQLMPPLPSRRYKSRGVRKRRGVRLGSVCQSRSSLVELDAERRHGRSGDRLVDPFAGSLLAIEHVGTCDIVMPATHQHQLDLVLDVLDMEGAPLACPAGWLEYP